MRSFLIILAFTCCLPSFAQYSRRMQPLYETEGGYYHPRGFHFAPGITYLLPNDFSRDAYFPMDTGEDFEGEITAGGKVGLYLEVGHAHFLPHWMPIEYIDYGVAFKMLRGNENMTGNRVDSETGVPIELIEREANFTENFGSIYLNFTKFIQVRDYQFITIGLGANADLRINSNIPEEEASLEPVQYTENFLAQAHLKIGYGFKLQENLFFMPSIETPIVTGYPFEDGKSTLPYFHTRYRPIILTLRFQWLKRKKPEDCVGKKDPKGSSQLWDPKMRRKRK